MKWTRIASLTGCSPHDRPLLISLGKRLRVVQLIEIEITDCIVRFPDFFLFDWRYDLALALIPIKRAIRLSDNEFSWAPGEDRGEFHTFYCPGDCPTRFIFTQLQHASAWLCISTTKLFILTGLIGWKVTTSNLDIFFCCNKDKQFCLFYPDCPLFICCIVVTDV